MIYTTLNKIREHRPCVEGWEKLLSYLGKTKADDEPLPLVTVLDSNGLDDTLWCLRSVPEHSALWRLYAVWCVRQVEHLLTDERSKNAIYVAECHANGEASDEDLNAACDAAGDATREAYYKLGNASWYAARGAEATSRDVSCDTANATRVAAWDSVNAENAVDDASIAEASYIARGNQGPAFGAAYVSARAKQANKLREILTTGECK